MKEMPLAEKRKFPFFRTLYVFEIFSFCSAYLTTEQKEMKFFFIKKRKN
jgi:hypothetical protein